MRILDSPISVCSTANWADIVLHLKKGESRRRRAALWIAEYVLAVRANTSRVLQNLCQPMPSDASLGQTTADCLLTATRHRSSKLLGTKYLRRSRRGFDSRRLCLLSRPPWCTKTGVARRSLSNPHDLSCIGVLLVLTTQIRLRRTGTEKHLWTTELIAASMHRVTRCGPPPTSSTEHAFLRHRVCPPHGSIRHSEIVFAQRM